VLAASRAALAAAFPERAEKSAKVAP
jgi:hypothetical protein